MRSARSARRQISLADICHCQTREAAALAMGKGSRKGGRTVPFDRLRTGFDKLRTGERGGAAAGECDVTPGKHNNRATSGRRRGARTLLAHFSREMLGRMARGGNVAVGVWVANT